MLMRKVSDNKKTKRMAGVLTKAVAGTTAGMMTMAVVLAAVPVNVAADEVIMEWREENGVKYWYENGVRQGVKYNADGSIDISYRGKEIYDPSSAACTGLTVCRTELWQRIRTYIRNLRQDSGVQARMRTERK